MSAIFHPSVLYSRMATTLMLVAVTLSQLSCTTTQPTHPVNATLKSQIVNVPVEWFRLGDFVWVQKNDERQKIVESARNDKATREALLVLLDSDDALVPKIHVILTEAFEWPNYKATQTEFNGMTVFLSNENEPSVPLHEVSRIKARWLHFFETVRHLASQE